VLARDLDRPEAALLVRKALDLLGDEEARRALATAAAASIRSFDDAAYARGTVRLVERQKRRLR
jgi:hypothetical protein